jgi:hypothetical protein
VTRVSLRIPSPQQLAEQIDGVLQRSPEVRLIGIRSPRRHAWPETIERGGHRFRLVWSDSALELRDQLSGEGQSDRVVVLTNLPDEAMGADLLARFPRARLLQPDDWQMLRGAFQARDIDPRLAGEEWLADLLLEHAPAEGYPPVPGGVLDADTAWRHLLARTIRLEALRPDAEALLAWTLDETGIERFLALPEDVRSHITKHLDDVGGSSVALVIGAVVAGHGRSAIPLGLVLDVVLAGGEEREVRDAAVRLEPVFGCRIDRGPALRFAEAAKRLVGRLDRARAETFQARAGEWLERLHIEDFARLSEYVSVGFEQRLMDAAELLRSAIEGGGPFSSAEAAVEAVLRHEQARVDEKRAERARMALRLVRWLASPERSTAGFADAAVGYAREGGFVDLARNTLFDGDQRSDVSAVYELIANRATERRERENVVFARALQAWNSGRPSESDVVPVEQFLDRVLAPIAHLSNVLLIVFDGLSYAVYWPLFSDLVHQGWIELMPDGRAGSPPLIAALLSVTEVSRASLLSGRLVGGRASDERNAFAQHSLLVACSRASWPPLLFHKGLLGSANALAEDVPAAIADPHQRVVGVVHNVVDAQLDGSDQLDVDWSLEEVRFARALLREARDAERIVVLASDHGHILDRGSAQYSAEGGARWRRPAGQVRPFELAFEGGRVLAPEGLRHVVLPWSESVRYGAKSRGYHGGAAPQEVVAPLTVMCTGTAPPGWCEAPPVLPSWWEQSIAVQTPLVKPKHRTAKRNQAELFQQPLQTTSPSWIDLLIASPTYRAQKQLAGRVALRDEDIVRLLQALDERGGRLTQTALAQALRQPVVRMGGLVSAAARVLNVDQSRILHLDRTSQTITLVKALLERQFELGKV